MTLINSNEELKAIFDYNPLPLTTDSTRTPEVTPFPFWFYDKHLDSKLSLSRVERMPSLPKDLSASVDQAFKNATERGIKLPLINNRSSFVLAKHRNRGGTKVYNAHSVADHYCDTTAKYCLSIASTLAIHPSAPFWATAFMWNQTPERGLLEYSSEGYSLRLHQTPLTHEFEPSPKLVPFLDRSTVENLQDIINKFPDLATWVIGDISDESVAMLRDIDRVIDSNSFFTEVCGTTGHRANDTVLPHSPDARSNSWSTGDSPPRVDAPNQGPRRTLRSRRPPLIHRGKENHEEQKQARPTKGEVKPVMTTVGKDVLPSMQMDCYSSSAERFLQHAWARAVKKDTSIIVFHCGNFERIGIRHRQSQTLYLSDMIDVVNCKNPAYGKLHVGLYISALEDAMDRVKQLREIEVVLNNPSQGPPIIRRRPTTDTQAPKKNARAKTNTYESNFTEQCNSQNDDIFRRASLCNLALFRLQYDIFNSSSPASFLRTGRSLSPLVGPLQRPRVRRKYLPHEYLTVIIRSEIGSGATGILHEAKIEVAAGDLTLSRDIVAKFAFTAEQQVRMRHDIYGMFEDLEGGGLALLMSNGGKNLWECRSIDVPDDFQVKVVEPERTAFLKAISRVHQAGVHHRDIRPNNFLINDAGEITIIDFDKALLNPSKGAMRREYKNLALLLDGEYDPPDGLSTEATTDSAADLSDDTEMS